jgi:hypothetical protein
MLVSTAGEPAVEGFLATFTHGSTRT